MCIVVVDYCEEHSIRVMLVEIYSYCRGEAKPLLHTCQVNLKHLLAVNLKKARRSFRTIMSTMGICGLWY